jgi:tRNA-dihydrouridine synthase B
MLRTSRQDRPLGAQLVGDNEYDLLFAAQLLQDKGISWIDINAACPVRKVVSKGAGAYLLKDLKKLEAMLSLLAKNLKIPLSVKIRSGFSRNNSNAVEVAKVAQDCGVDAVIIHGRDREQQYSGTVNYALIAAVKKTLDIPLIASGDILSAELAKKMFDETGCDLVGVARGALGNPWIFKEIDNLIKSGKPLKLPAQEEIIKTLFSHLSGSIELYGEKRSLPKMRKVICSYVRNFRGAKKMRVKINQAESLADLKEILKNLN